MIMAPLSTSFPFLALPTELRLQVLWAVFPTSILDLRPPPTYYALLLTSRSISELTLSLLPQFTFHITNLACLRTLSPPRFRAIIPQIKHLRLDIRMASAIEQNARTGLDEFTALEEFPALQPGDRAIKTTWGMVTATHPHISRMSPYAMYSLPAVPIHADLQMYFEHDWPKLLDALQDLHMLMPKLERLRLNFINFSLWSSFPTLVGVPPHTLAEVASRVIYRGINAKHVEITGLGTSLAVDEIRNALTL